MKVAQTPSDTCEYYYTYLRPCGNWRCSHCSVLTQRLWTSRVEMGLKQHIDSGGQARLITLTLPGRERPGVDSLFARFAVLRRSLSRTERFGPWARGIGLGTNKRPHLHLIELATGAMSDDEVRHRIESAGFGSGNPQPVAMIGTSTKDIQRSAAYLTREAIIVATSWTEIGGRQEARPIKITWPDPPCI